MTLGGILTRFGSQQVGNSKIDPLQYQPNMMQVFDPSRLCVVTLLAVSMPFGHF